MNLNGICLITDNFKGLKEFYENILRDKAEADEDYAAFSIRGAKFSIFSKRAMENMVPDCREEAGYGNCVVEFEVEDVDKEYILLKEKAVVFVKSPTTQPWGIRSVWFRDPDGNLINFYAEVK